MLTNSLFLDFLKENGLEVWKDESTRDVICVQFDYGTHTYKEEIKAIDERIKKAKKDKNLSDEDKQKRLETLNLVKEKVKDNKDKFKRKTRQEIREIFYQDGLNIEYPKFNRKKEITGYDVIHYKMAYRTPGKAKKGSCMFIRDKLYDKAINFLRMGLQLPDTNAPIVEIGAYSSLSTSTIVDHIVIDPDQILVIKDIDSFFNTQVISVELDENKHCQAIKKDNYKVKNTLFDGQALIDESIFPEWGKGYILLRHHFTKMAAFRSNIQLFMQEYFGDEYETAIIKDMWGRDVKVSKIKLITTDNAMKWIKFKVDFNYWSKWVRANGCKFGIVKTAHKSKFGDVQRMSYQMINALDIDTMEETCKCTVDYIMKLKKDDHTFMEYLIKNENFSNDFEVLVALVEHNPEFVRCDYFRERKKRIIYNYLKEIKNGKLIQDADNLVIVGSPYAMLLASVGEDVNKDTTLLPEDGAIQCYTERFKDGEYLAGFRSPFNSRNNMDHLHNHYDDRLKKYFTFGKQIIAINMIGTDAQDRNNGSDQDSDSLYVTNQSSIVKAAKKFYKEYPTIVNNIPKEANHYNNTPSDFARIDNNLAASQRAIGESSNLAQIALSYTYNFKDPICYDSVCILSVLAQCAIDNSKRKYDIDITNEIQRLKNLLQVDKRGYPKFWCAIRPGFDKNKINKSLRCPMNYIYKMKVDSYKPVNDTLPMSYFFVKHELTEHHRLSRRVEKLIEKYSLKQLLFVQDDDDDNEDYYIFKNNFDQLIDDIHQIYISKNYLGLMSHLITRAFFKDKIAHAKLQTRLEKNRSVLLKALYNVNKRCFLQCFKMADH